MHKGNDSTHSVGAGVGACSSNWSTFPLMKVLILFVFIAFLDAIIYLVCFGFIRLCLL